jgi:hypothetical protein
LKISNSQSVRLAAALSTSILVSRTPKDKGKRQYLVYTKGKKHRMVPMDSIRTYCTPPRPSLVLHHAPLHAWLHHKPIAACAAAILHIIVLVRDVVIRRRRRVRAVASPTTTSAAAKFGLKTLGEGADDVEDVERGEQGADAEEAAVVVLRLGPEVGGGDVANPVGHPGEGVEEEGGEEGDLAGEEERGDAVGEVVVGEFAGGVEVGFDQAEDELWD